jgi:hypothetical protein
VIKELAATGKPRTSTLRSSWPVAQKQISGVVHQRYPRGRLPVASRGQASAPTEVLRLLKRRLSKNATHEPAGLSFL